MLFAIGTLNFNPRSREGSDVRISADYIVCIISIHAPAKGATQGRRLCACVRQDFNPRSREGSDPGFSVTVSICCIFQSTLPRRERPAADRCVHRQSHFNPRSREGSDAPITSFADRLSHFNPRSREGSDLSSAFALSTCSAFQSTLPRRERPPRALDTKWHACNFNPRSREGSDPHAVRDSESDLHFNPRSREGSDPLRSGGFRRVNKFQSTLPRRERLQDGLCNGFYSIFQSTLPRRERPCITAQPSCSE